MHFTLLHKNREYDVAVDENLLVGHFIIYFLSEEGIDIIDEIEKYAISWELWSMSYSLSMNQSFKEQALYINLSCRFQLHKSSYGDVNYFKSVEQQAFEIKNSIQISRKINQYSPFLDFIMQGVNIYIQTLNTNNLIKYLEPEYIEDDFMRLKEIYDMDGVFTKKIFKTFYIIDDKYCSEEPIECLNFMFKNVLGNIPYKFDLHCVFSKFREGKIGELVINQNGEYSKSHQEMNELFKKGECKYYLKFYCKDFIVEKDLEGMRYQFKAKIELLNTILEKLSINKRCFQIYSTSFFFINELDYKKLKRLYLLPVNTDFYNVFTEI